MPARLPLPQVRSRCDHSADRGCRVCDSYSRSTHATLLSLYSMIDVHGHFHGFGCQWCRFLIESAHTEHPNAAEAFEDTFR
jgi:hypothetical protein